MRYGNIEDHGGKWFKADGLKWLNYYQTLQVTVFRMRDTEDILICLRHALGEPNPDTTRFSRTERLSGQWAALVNAMTDMGDGVDGATLERSFWDLYKTRDWNS